MDLSGAQARYQLNTGATPVGTNVAGPNTIGVGLTQANFTTADIAYSFKVTATGNGDVATLTYSNGAVAQTTGTPTIADAGNTDFEGVATSTLVTLYSVLVQAGTANTGSVTVANSDTRQPDAVLGVASMCMLLDDGDFITSFGTMALTLSASGDTAIVSLIGKSS